MTLAIYNPSPKVSKSRRCPVRFAGRWEQSLHCQQKKILNRFSIQNRCDQTRQQSSAGTARRHSRSNPQSKQIAPLSGAICGKMGTKESLRIKEEIGSLPDPISMRPSAAASVRRHCRRLLVPIRGRLLCRQGSSGVQRGIRCRRASRSAQSSSGSSREVPF